MKTLYFSEEFKCDRIASEGDCLHIDDEVYFLTFNNQMHTVYINQVSLRLHDQRESKIYQRQDDEIAFV